MYSPDRNVARESANPSGTDGGAAGSSEAGVCHSASANMGDCKAVMREVGGRTGLEPTRFGDWEKNGRCIDF